MNRLLSMGAQLFVPDKIGPSYIPDGLFPSLSSEIGEEDAGENCSVHEPVFLLSAGWRSGSTFLQRLICSDPSVMMWGEPFGDSVAVPRLAASVAELGAKSAHWNHTLNVYRGSLEREWIANLNPGRTALRDAHLAYYTKLFEMPSKSLGYARWGVKWVRLTAFHAAYLKWLYPGARFIFLIRHPLDAYQSYKGRSWFWIRPNHKVDNVLKFVGAWRFLTESFLTEHQKLGAMLIRYEDLLVNPKVVLALEDFLKLKINREILRVKIGSSERSKKPVRLWESTACHLLTKDLCELLGYTKTGNIPCPLFEY